MARLIDDLKSGSIPLLCPPWISGSDDKLSSRIKPKSIVDRFDKSVVFDITNIAHYIWCETSQEQFLPDRDFPCIAPPFKSIWMEYKQPPYINSEEFGVIPISDIFPARVGVECNTFSMEEEGVRSWTKEQLDVRLVQSTQGSTCVSKTLKTFQVHPSSKILKRIKEEVMESKWHVRMTFYAQNSKYEVMGPMEEILLWLDSRGDVVDFLYQWPCRSDKNLPLNEMKHYDAMFYPALMALSMMNCKNVSQVDNKPPAKLAKASLKRKGVAPVTYKTLVIDHLKTVASRKDAGGETTGIRRALHICRGHFAEYGGPKGKLFGKIEGRFWIPQHVRGTQDLGVVVKDYEVK